MQSCIEKTTAGEPKVVAEHLPHLGVVVLHLQGGQVVSVGSTPEGVRVVWESGATTSVRLPRSVAAPPQLKTTAHGHTARIAVHALDSDARRFDRLQNWAMKMADDVVVWLNRDLARRHPLLAVLFVCSSCGRTLISNPKLQDMPLEVWAEMMEFWHCHKPHDHSQAPAHRYSTLTPRPGCVLVLSGELIVNPGAWGHADGLGGVVCSCGAAVGREEGQLWHLAKWRVRLVAGTDEEVFPPHVQTYTQLLALVNSQATRVFVLEDEAELAASGTLVWVFSIDTDVVVGDTTLHNALKVLVLPPDHPKWRHEMETREQQLETLVLPTEVLADTVSTMDRVHRALPQDAAEVMGWPVSFLAGRP